MPTAFSVSVKPLSGDLYPLAHAYSADARSPLPPRLPVPAYTSVIGGMNGILADHGGRVSGIVEARCNLGGPDVELR